jgi:hypothetical protein
VGLRRRSGDDANAVVDAIDITPHQPGGSDTIVGRTRPNCPSPRRTRQCLRLNETAAMTPRIASRERRRKSRLPCRPFPGKARVSP